MWEHSNSISKQAAVMFVRLAWMLVLRPNFAHLSSQTGSDTRRRTDNLCASQLGHRAVLLTSAHHHGGWDKFKISPQYIVRADIKLCHKARPCVLAW